MEIENRMPGIALYAVAVKTIMPLNRDLHSIHACNKWVSGLNSIRSRNQSTDVVLLPILTFVQIRGNFLVPNRIVFAAIRPSSKIVL